VSDFHKKIIVYSYEYFIMLRIRMCNIVLNDYRRD